MAVTTDGKHHYSITSFCLFLVAQGVAGGVVVEWLTPQSDWSNKIEGSTVEIKCAVRGLESTVGALSIEKEVEGASRIIATNQIVDPPYSRFTYNGEKRFEVHYVVTKDESTNTFFGVQHLTIKGVQSEDAGHFYCEAMGLETERRTLAVIVPVEDAYIREFYPNDTSAAVPDDCTVTLKDGWRSGVGCSVILRSEFVPPEIYVTIGGKDVTDTLEVALPVKVKDVADVERPTFMVTFSFFTTRPDVAWHGEEFVCKAHTPGFETQTRKATARLAVEFHPYVTCDHYEYHGQLRGTVVMSCSVYANPDPNIRFRFGYYLSDNFYNLTSSYITDGGYSFRKTELNAGYTNVTFTIRALRLAHFQYTYKMYAQNQYGQSTVTLLLYEGTPGGVNAASQCDHRHTITSFLVVILVTLSHPFQPR